MRRRGPEALLHQPASLAIDRAAAALSTLIHESVRARGPSIFSLSSPEMLLLRFRSMRRLWIATQTVYSENEAKISLALSRDSAGVLADLLMGRRGVGTRNLAGLEMDAIRETANIVSGAFLAALGERTGLRETPSVPSLVQGELQDLIQNFTLNPESLCVES